MVSTPKLFLVPSGNSKATKQYDTENRPPVVCVILETTLAGDVRVGAFKKTDFAFVFFTESMKQAGTKMPQVIEYSISNTVLRTIPLLLPPQKDLTK